MLIRLLAGMALGLAVGFAHADSDADSGGALVDTVLAHPGVWSQMCSLSPPQEPAGIFCVGFDRPYSTHRISESNFTRLREHRAEVLEAISERLDRARTEGIASIVPGLDSPESPWGIPNFDYLDMLLAMLIDLNGIEDMPALLRYEATVDATANYGQTDVSLTLASPPPHVTIPTFTGHMRVLSTIAAILAKETPDTMEETNMFIGTGITRAYAPYSKENRDTLIRVAETYVAETDVAAYKGAAGMEEKPKRR